MIGDAATTLTLRYSAPSTRRIGVADQSAANRPAVSPEVWIVNASESATIGRDPACQIVIDSGHYSMVSRRHAEVRYSAVDGVSGWWLCDLNSANGTFLNGQRLDGCQRLQGNDLIVLGQKGPKFHVEAPLLTLPPEAVGTVVASDRRSSHAEPVSAEVTLTQLFPILSSGLDLQRKAYLLPGAVAVTFVVGLFMTIDQPQLFNILVASFLAIACYYVIYQLCGKPKPASILVLTALTTALLLRSPVLPWFISIFREWLPGDVSQPALAFPSQLLRMFFGAGLMEELLKALPLLAIMVWSSQIKSPAKRSRWGIVEPLDGILLGAASAIGFTMLETLGQYVPDIVQNTQLQAGADLSQLRGLQLLIPRLLGSISGHMAYSGYFGYFLGLAVLRSRRRWQIVLIGYVTAAGLHALWNTMGGVSPLLLAAVGMLSYAFLAAAIVKARSLSPNRSQNFATRLKS